MPVDKFLIVPTSLRICAYLVVLAAIHSIVLGIIFVINPLWLLNLFDWTTKPDTFYLRQAGVFHILLGLFYLLEFFAYGAVRMLVAAKFSAVVFLSIQLWCGMREPAVLISTVGDGSMLALVLVYAIRSRKTAEPA